MVARYAYDGWGNHAVLNPDGTDNDSADFIGNVNPFRYRGYYYDKETGLYFLKTRYYDPEICRFINVDDTAYLDAESINGLNLYAYCADNPIMNVDPDGTSVSASVELGGWKHYYTKDYIWRSPKYNPRRSYKSNGNILSENPFKKVGNPFQNLGNNLLYMGELILSTLELNVGARELTFLSVGSGFTLISSEFTWLDGRMNFADSDYIGVGLGSFDFSLLDFRPMENKYVVVDTQATLFTAGVYSEYGNAEVLVGSVGFTLKVDNGMFTFGLSLGLGLRFSLKLW